MTISSRSIRRFVAPLVGALLAGAAPLAAQAPKHMLFRAEGPNGATVFFLGSVHLLDSTAGKLPPVIDSAFARAKTVAFEANLDTLMMHASEILARAQYPAGQTLRSSLSPAAVPKVDSVLHLYGISMEQVNRFKPWFVAAGVLEQVVMMRAHFEPKYGVDVQLNARAHEAGKRIIGLEPVEFQFSIFDQLSPAAQERMLTEDKGPDSSAAELNRIKNAWRAGDTRMLDSLLNRQAEQSPDMFAALLVNRNKSWMPKIEELLRGKDDALVVVGAAHLVGKQGVLQMLRDRGYKVEQL